MWVECLIKSRSKLTGRIGNIDYNIVRINTILKKKNSQLVLIEHYL